MVFIGCGFTSGGQESGLHSVQMCFIGKEGLYLDLIISAER